MNDQELDQLVRQAQPHSGAALGSLDLRQGGQHLLEQIMAMPVTPQLESPGLEPVEVLDVTPGSAQHRRRYRRSLVGVAAAAAVAAAIAGPMLTFQGGGHQVEVVTAAHSGPAEPEVSGNPRLLIDQPGWKVVYTEESMPTAGEVQYKNGRRNLQLDWYAANLRQGYYDDRKAESTPEKVTVLGQESVLFQSSPKFFEVLLPADGKTFLMIGGGGVDRATFLADVNDLKPVTQAQWDTAMPKTVVTPGEAIRVGKEMVADVPLPPGYDTSKPAAPGTNDYYQYGAAVMAKVACGWLKEYETARAASNEAGMARVGRALSTNPHWKVLQTMAKSGGYPIIMRTYLERAIKRQDLGNYQPAIGCS